MSVSTLAPTFPTVWAGRAKAGGIHVLLSEPVAALTASLVLEGGCFDAAHAQEAPPEPLQRALPGPEALPQWGPVVSRLRPHRGSGEQMQATMATSIGLALGAQRDPWRQCDAAESEMLGAAFWVEGLKKRFPATGAAIDALGTFPERVVQSMVYEPVTGRISFLAVMHDASGAEVTSFMQWDPV